MIRRISEYKYDPPATTNTQTRPRASGKQDIKDSSAPNTTHVDQQLAKATQAWWAAKAANNQAEMDKQHQLASQLRVQGASLSQATAASIKNAGQAMVDSAAKLTVAPGTAPRATGQRDLKDDSIAKQRATGARNVDSVPMGYTATGNPATPAKTGGLLDMVVSGFHFVEGKVKNEAVDLAKKVQPYVRPTVDFIKGAAAETAINMGLGIARLNPNVNKVMDRQSHAFQWGRVAGDSISAGVGVVETIAGVGGTAAEVAAAPETGGLTLAASPATAALTAHGVGVAAASSIALPNSISHAVHFSNKSGDTNVISKNVQRLPNNEMTPPTKRGNAPVSNKDGKPIEIHHEGQSPDGPFTEMHQTDHRGPGAFKDNHANTGQEKSQIDRKVWDRQRRAYWQGEFDGDRWKK